MVSPLTAESACRLWATLQPMDLKPAEHLGRAQWEICLRWAFAAMCAAMAWRGFCGDQLFSLLFITCDWSESAAMATNRVVAAACAVSGVLVLWRRSPYPECSSCGGVRGGGRWSWGA